MTDQNNDTLASFRGPRTAALGHHLRIADRWLSTASDAVSVTYAAFELRLEIECIGIELFKVANSGELSDDELTKLRTFDKSERFVYALDGNQKEISKKLEFLALMLEGANLQFNVVKPRLSDLKRSWQTCSGYCHGDWTYLSARAPSLVVAAITELRSIRDFVRDYSAPPNLAWPGQFDASYLDLRTKYVAGAVSRDDVVTHFRQLGMTVTLLVSGQPDVRLA